MAGQEGAATAGSSSTTTTSSSSIRRQFAVLGGRFRFHMPQGRVLDICLDGAQTLMEGAVYMLGPFLICLALAIVGLLSYTFFHVLVPMMLEKHADKSASLRLAVVSLHGAVVNFLVFNILFNYAMCVVTKNDGPVYDRIVRELAAVTGFVFPETPAQTLEYRRDFEDRMVLRMRRRRAREEEAEAANTAQHKSSSGNPNEDAGQVVTHRRGTTATENTQNTAARKKTKNTLPSTVVRRWMLMGPYEWGFCGNSMQPKPPRSHFDHVTKKLVLNLDVDPAYHTLRQRERVAGHHLHKPHPMLPRREEKMLISLSFMLCLAVGCAVLMLGGFHIYLTLTAQTTIEFHGNWAKRKRLGSKFKNPYDQGWKRNWCQVFGDQPWYIAILPSRREPDYLPVPIPGKNTLRKNLGLYDPSDTAADSIV
eukprot:scaffold3195_cov162-Amphora_coffeaeformis.AAC.16